VLAGLPKISGYVQAGYYFGDAGLDNRSSFLMKRMRVILDKKLGRRFDIRAQFEVFSSSVDATASAKKLTTAMDVFANAYIHKAFNLRFGQYYQPLGFENYDISPATLEVIDFSSITYRMVCRNAISSPGVIDYGRDLGVMAYGDLLPNRDKGFHYLSYNVSLTNGNLATLPDNNKSKDVAARLTVRPVKNLRLTGSYNWGEYRGLNAAGETEDYLPMNRFIAGVWWNDPSGLVVRSEVARAESPRAGIKEDGAYVLAGYRFGKWLPVLRWDAWRDRNNTGSAVNRDNFLAGCTYEATPAVKFQLNYIHTMFQPYGMKHGNSVTVMALLKF
jgi:phosphate-selective porin